MHEITGGFATTSVVVGSLRIQTLDDYLSTVEGWRECSVSRIHRVTASQISILGSIRHHTHLGGGRMKVPSLAAGSAAERNDVRRRPLATAG